MMDDATLGTGEADTETSVAILGSPLPGSAVPCEAQTLTDTSEKSFYCDISNYFPFHVVNY